MYLEIRNQPHLMVAEGSANRELSEETIIEAILKRGYAPCNIQIFYDDLQKSWKFIADIEEI